VHDQYIDYLSSLVSILLVLLSRVFHESEGPLENLAICRTYLLLATLESINIGPFDNLGLGRRYFLLATLESIDMGKVMFEIILANFVLTWCSSL